MIAIYQRTASGVVRADTATTVAEAHDKLGDIRAPAMAFDGGDPVGATGYTSTTYMMEVDPPAFAEALRRMARQGKIDLRDYPLVAYLGDIMIDGRSGEIPWRSFVSAA